MSNELNINDADFLQSLKSHKDLIKEGNVKRDYAFREPKANKRKDMKRSVAMALEESQYQVVVDYARNKNCSIAAAVTQFLNDYINNQIKKNNG